MPPLAPEPLPIDLPTCDKALTKVAEEIRRSRHPSARVSRAHRELLGRRLEELLEHRSVLVRREVRRLELMWERSWPGLSADHEVGL